MTDNRDQDVFRFSGAIWSDYFIHTVIACTQHTTTHFDFPQSMFPPDSSNASYKSTLEYKNQPTILNKDEPGLAALKKSTKNYVL